MSTITIPVTLDGAALEEAVTDATTTAAITFLRSYFSDYHANKPEGARLIGAALQEAVKLALSSPEFRAEIDRAVRDGLIEGARAAAVKLGEKAGRAKATAGMIGDAD